MAIKAAEIELNGLSTPISSYDQDEINLGTLMRTYGDSASEDGFSGPMPLAIARPMEQSTGFAVAFPHVIAWSDNIDWVFLIENSTAGATRRIMLYEFYKDKAIFNWRGFVTLTYPVATAHTSRALRVLRDVHTTGTVAVTGTAVTGTSTLFTTNRIAVGARIGFGSTDPTLITNWFEITAIASDTSITLNRAVPATLSAGTAYVIEELRAITITTNATVTNGGLFVAKGLNFNIFNVGGTTIPAAAATDNIRAVYFLGDAVTQTNTVAGGCALGPRTDFQNQIVYVPDGAASSLKFYAYNIRAALTLTTGRATNAILATTGAQTVTGTISQNNNGRYDTLSHGPGAGVPSIYLVTTTRVIRCPVALIQNGFTNFVADAMVEIPPGGANTFAATSGMASLEIASNIDRMIITTTNNRAYVSKYNTISQPIDHIFMADTRQLDQSTTAETTYPHLAFNTSLHSLWSEGGILYLCRTTTVATTHQLYAVPLGAHCTYAAATNQRVITPRIATPQAKRLLRAYASSKQYFGSIELGIPAEPFLMYARTAGIADNSGSWTLLNASGTLSGLDANDYVQLMFEFKMIGTFCVPNRIYNACVTYEVDSVLPDELEWNLADSSSSNGTMGFKQIAVFGGGTPSLTINYYRSDNNANVLTQSSASSTNGTFEYWTGSAWAAGIGPNTIATRRRFVPSAGLPASTDVYAKITIN
jgi:hypothetical protein